MNSLGDLDRSELRAAVHAALRAWHASRSMTPGILDSLLIHQERPAGSSDQSNPTVSRLATNQLLLEAIETLEEQDQMGGRILRLRFADDNTLLMVANKLNVSEHTISRMQRTAIDRLAEIVYEREVAAREELANVIEARLPPATYSQLFGLVEAKRALLEQLLASGPPWAVAIVGIGGIGKTALADAVSRSIIRQFRFRDLVWARADAQTMSGRAIDVSKTYDNLVFDLAASLGLSPAASPEQQLVQVRQQLKSEPYLIVVDNIETEPETAYFLDRINDLAQPSKFLLTTRTRPAAQATVYHFQLDELSQEDALALLRRQAKEIGAGALEEASEEDLKAVYQVTGGNPLALKLVVSLLDLLPLTHILEALMRSQPGPVEELYRHIYWQTWQVLTPNARKLLQVMPLVAESGALPDYLMSLSGLGPDEIWPAMQELRARSLLEVRGTIQEKRYGVHRLTETFLRTEIVGWPEG